MSTVLIIILVVVALLVIYLITCYNSFVKLNNKIKEAYATMDVYLKKRYDLIPNLVETVKGYAKHEQGTLEKVIQARNMAMNAGSVDERVEGENILSGTLKSLFALSESYPDLKANENFVSLQSDLNRMEEEIASSRKYYNAIVNTFNTKTEVFPSNLIANMFGFSVKPLFEVENENERQNVKVEF
ncbi:LemA family protein [Anaerofustis stercorihominis]|uniref:LemA family protein n=1 Tax=Anaerofustis stercorihominis DSM 17244 TaxID=445971 RepID=B1C6B5_9FIRM|nr:LemA family protein [Anaerofustis stercorihominis]EDS73400.1 LemA family protein [Anaerofustis stercorihominis DSM 17244]MCQ4794849.1 LemA family protein [Anaerofustis stercorihominis]MCR2032974.1 LemA family protein [Anaerofustis stercorihominis]